MRAMKSGGGWNAVLYTARMANRVGWLPLWHAMRGKNACKTCALGMGGQLGGMVNEGGHFPEVCKKSLQAMASDMQDRIAPEFFQRYSIAELRTLSPRELEGCGRLVDPVYAAPGATHYRVITWDDALERVARRAVSFMRADARRTKRGFSFSSLRGCSARTTSTTAPTTATRRAASG